MKFTYSHMYIAILIANIVIGINAYSISNRKLKTTISSDWQKELLNSSNIKKTNSDPYNYLPRSLKIKDNWMSSKKLKRNPEEVKRIKSEIEKLKKKLVIIDPNKKTKKYIKNLDHHRKQTRKLKRKMTSHLNQNVFRALILQKIFENNNQNHPVTLNQFNPFGTGVSTYPQLIPNKSVQITPRIRSLLLKNLTLKDFDAIAKKKLTMERYTSLLASTEGLPTYERKNRYLNIIADSFGQTLNAVLSTVDGISKNMNKIAQSPQGKYLGVGTLGVMAGLKHRKNKKFLHNRERLLKEIEMYDTVNTLIDEQKRGTNKTADYIANLIVRAKSIADNLGYRFDSKCRLFGSFNR